MRTSHDLRGSCPDSSRVALVIIDMIDHCALPEGDPLRRHAEPAARRIAGLATRARAAYLDPERRSPRERGTR